MRVPFGTRRPRCNVLLVGVVVALVLSVSPGLAGATDPRLERAQDERREVQAQLDDVLQRIGRVEAAIDDAQTQLDALAATAGRHDEQARAAAAKSAAWIRGAYKHGQLDPLLALLAAQDPGELGEQARLLGIAASHTRRHHEAAAAAHARTQARAAQVRTLADELAARRTQLAAARAEARELVARAEQAEQRVRRRLAAEEAARRRAAEEAARLAAQRDDVLVAASRAGPAAESGGQTSSGTGGGSGGGGGGIACPVGQPRSYTDTWGAPRSGGRRHMGTDILAPYGTPIYAYESGTIARMNGSVLGGISLYLAGDSGTVYFYTHLQGYAAGLSPGARVAAGQHIAHNGDSGNAAGIPHLHFEVAPGGGGGVNPYPYVRRACG